MSLRRIVFLDNEAAVAGDDFGWSVAIKNDTISVGCPFDYVDGNKTGSAYLFDNLPGDLDADGDVDFLDFAVLAGCWRQNNPLADKSQILLATGEQASADKSCEFSAVKSHTELRERFEQLR